MLTNTSGTVRAKSLVPKRRKTLTSKRIVSAKLRLYYQDFCPDFGNFFYRTIKWKVYNSADLMVITKKIFR